MEKYIEIEEEIRILRREIQKLTERISLLEFINNMNTSCYPLSERKTDGK